MSEKIGRIIEVLDPSNVVVNRGSEHGIHTGQTVVVFAIGQELKDPETGESLGPLEIFRGRGTVIHAQPKVCTVRSTETRREFSDRLRKKVPNMWNRLSTMTEPFEYVTEPVEVPAPFEDVKVGDHVRF